MSINNETAISGHIEATRAHRSDHGTNDSPGNGVMSTITALKKVECFLHIRNTRMRNYNGKIYKEFCNLNFFI